MDRNTEFPSSTPTALRVALQLLLYESPPHELDSDGISPHAPVWEERSGARCCRGVVVARVVVPVLVVIIVLVVLAASISTGSIKNTAQLESAQPKSAHPA